MPQAGLSLDLAVRNAPLGPKGDRPLVGRPLDLHRLDRARLSQTGYVRAYALVILGGAVAVLGYLLWS